MSQNMIETQQGPERVLLVGVQTRELTDEKFEVLMKELKSLTETAGGVPTSTITQKLSSTDNKTMVGSGKLEDVKAIVARDDINLVITLNDMSPSVNQHLEEELGIRVIDRIQLILDIFAMRARSREGKLQVELAQYNYLLPRIIGKGTSLSRLGGGIGTRGPGETQLETDRRHIRSRVNALSKELKQVEEHRERTRRHRQSGRDFNIGLVGYTNAGKSTLLRELTFSDTYVKDQLFATLDPLTRKLKINGHDAFTITDTVGFIEELPTQLIHAFKSTLEEIRYLDLLIHVVDASNPAHPMHEDTVRSLLKDLEVDTIPIITVYNKKDKVDETFAPTIYPSIVISAFTDADLDQLKQLIWDVCIENSERYEVDIKPEEADLLALYRQKTLIESMDYNEETDVYEVKGYRRNLI